MDTEYVLCECDLEPLKQFVTSLESRFNIQIANGPAVCLTMIKAEDSVEFQPFFLGEALTAECEVLIDGRIGVGICLGDEPVRSYCLAVIDAVLQLEGEHRGNIERFLAEQDKAIGIALMRENNLILKTRVDFKLMEQD